MIFVRLAGGMRFAEFLSTSTSCEFASTSKYEEDANVGGGGMIGAAAALPATMAKTQIPRVAQSIDA